MDVVKGAVAAKDAVEGALKGVGLMSDPRTEEIKLLKNELREEKVNLKMALERGDKLRQEINQEKEKNSSLEVRLERCRERVDELNKSEVNLKFDMKIKDLELSSVKEKLEQSEKMLGTEREENIKLKAEVVKHQSIINGLKKNSNAQKGKWKLLSFL